MLSRRGLVEGLKGIFSAPTACRECGAALSCSEEISFDFFMPLRGGAYKETRWYQLWCCPRSALHQVYGRRRTRVTCDGPWD